MLGRSAEAHREDLKKTFSSIITRLIEGDAQFLLIAGDLFDSNAVSQEYINFVVRELKRVGGNKYVIIIPGSHDPLTENSVYRKKELLNVSPHVHIFQDENLYYKTFPEHDITFWARPNISNRSRKSPLDIDREQVKIHTGYNVVLAHGSVEIPGKSSPDDHPVEFSRIASSEMDYIALGHWHGAQDFSQGGASCWYSGSPEITYQEGKGGLGSGYILEVTLEKGKTGIHPVRVSERDFDERVIDVSDLESHEELGQKILEGGNARLIRLVRFTGLSSPRLTFDESAIEEEYGDIFFALKIKNEAHLRPDLSLYEKEYPPEFISGQFFRILKEKLAATKDSKERGVIEEALQLGISELEGKRII